MKNIGLIIHSSSSSGGVDQYSKSMLEAVYDSENYNLVLFIKENDNRFKDYKCVKRTFSKPSSNLYGKAILALSFWIYKAKKLYISKSDQDKFDDIDLFLSPSNSLYPHFFLDKPFLFTLHDLQEKYFPKFFTLKERVSRHLTKSSLSHDATGIICESESVKNDILKYIGVKEEKIHLLPAPPPKTFMDSRISVNMEKQVKIKYQLNNDYLYYPANTWYHKNHIRLLEAFDLIKDQFSNLDLVLTGGKKNNLPNIKKKIEELELSNRVKFLGYVDYEELPYLYKMSEMLVMPTLFESISLPIYEAFSLGIPVCCSDVTGLPEQVGDAALLFNPYDIHDMADNIAAILQDEKLASELGMKGHNRISELNHDKYAKRLNSIINSVL